MPVWDAQPQPLGLVPLALRGIEERVKEAGEDTGVGPGDARDLRGLAAQLGHDKPATYVGSKLGIYSETTGRVFLGCCFLRHSTAKIGEVALTNVSDR